MDYAYALRAAASKFPSRPAIVFGDEVLSYAELDSMVDRMAAALTEMGLARRTVASFVLNEPSSVALYLALARIGAVSVPVNTRLTVQEQVYVVEDSGACALVVDRDLADTGLEVSDRLDAVESVIVSNGTHPRAHDLSSLAARQSGSEPEPVIDGRDVATIMYTSGTTGFPKGVVRTHEANLWNITNSALGSPRRPEDVEIFTLPIFGIGFMHFLMPTLLAGGCVILDRQFDARRTWSLLDEHRPTRIFLAPTMIDSMLDVPGSDQVDTSNLDVIYSAYEFPKPLREKALQRFGDRFVYMYGLTEAQLTAALPGEFAFKPSSAGKPMGLMRVAIIDETGSRLPVGTPGEIAFEGPSLMSGYHHDAEETEAALQDGWLRTGDLGYLDEEGDLHFTGRRKEIIKSGGFTVDPVEVERCLFAFHGVREAAVVGIPDEHWGEKVVAFVVTEPHGAVDIEALKDHCRRNLANFKVPKQVELLHQLPKNPTGKIERGRLRAAWSTSEMGEL